MKKILALFGTLTAVIIAAWFVGPSFLRSAGEMDDPRSEIHAAELDGVIYTTGGIGFFRTLSSCAAFDTANETFATCPNLPRPLHHVAMAAGDGSIWASGGYESLPFNVDPNGALFQLDLSELEPQWREISALPEPLGQHAMFYHQGTVWLIGGDRNGETTGALTLYDLSEGEWVEASPMPTPRHSHAYALDAEAGEAGFLYVTGGRSSALGSQSRVIEAYDFASDSWTRLPDAPFDLGGHGAAVFEGRLHVFGGEDLGSGTVIQDHAVLDLANLDAGWVMVNPVSLPRHGFATARVGNTVWILGGGKRAGMRTPWSVTGTAFSLPLK
ncbi:MAG: kelch repeat-containing protein [Pseudomonadota bacterium]